MAEATPVIDFADKKSNSGNPSTTNTGAAGQTASTNHPEVSFFSANVKSIGVTLVAILSVGM